MVKFCTYNARGLGDYAKRKQLYLLLKHKQLDVVFLQETHATDSQCHLWRSQWGGNIIYANGTSSSKGVMVLIRRGLDFQKQEVILDECGRYVMTEITIENCQFVICNLYAPNIDTPVFFSELKEKLAKYENSNIILGGDFNFVMDNQKDRLFSHCNNDRAKEEFLKLVEEYELCDVWRLLNSDKRQYSCCRPNSDSNEWQKFSRLDMFFVSAGLMNMVKKCIMQTGYQSDHSFVIMEINLAQSPRGPGYWKFNSSHLYDRQFLVAANAIIDEKSQELMEPILKWEYVKGAFIQFSKKYGVDKVKDKRKEMQQIEDELDFLKIQIEELPCCDIDTINRYQQINTKRKQLLQDKVNGCLVRSKERFYSEGERSSKYYFSLETHNARKKIMQRIRLQDGTTSSNQQKIMGAQFSFYRKLFKSNSNIKFNLINNTNRKITEQQRKELDKDLSLSELSLAVKEMPNNKTPGLDGLTIEVYKVFWERLGPIYFEAICKAKQRGSLHTDAKRGLITLLPKKDKDLIELTNWRPITLLTCDYKIIAKALAKRLQVVLPSIIDEDQTGFMKDRLISENIRKTIEVVQFTHDHKIPCIIMNLDYQKCFDYLEHTAIYGSLRYFSFGDKFIEWIRLMFTDIDLCNICNGFTTKWYKVERSVLQGSPLASFLYLLNGQILHDLIKNNADIKGINVNGIELLMSQFADDTTLFLTFEKVNLEAVISTLGIVHDNTGLTVNYDKTSIYRVGSLAGSQAKIYTTKSFTWTNEPIKLLGIIIPTSPNIQQTIDINYNPIICKMSTVISNWSLRMTSLMGKVLIVNTLIASLFVYKICVLPNMNNELTIKVNDKIVNFLWNGKKPKIAKDLLVCNKNQGGLRLVDITARQDALKVLWMPRIASSQLWASIFYNNLSNEITEMIWQVNLCCKDVKFVMKKNASIFWTQVLEAWCKFNYCPVKNDIDFRDQYIWYNSCIRINGRPVLFTQALNAGMNRISDIINENGEFLTYDEFCIKFGNCINWLNYMQIIDATPDLWKNMMTTNSINDYPVWYDHFSKLKLTKRCSGLVYTGLIDNPNRIERRVERWNRKLYTDYEPLSFLKFFRNVYQCTIATKYRDFQYRILTGTIVTNRLLFLWGKIESELCTFCKTDVEDDLHLFFECPMVQTIWDGVKNYVQENDTQGVFHTLQWRNENIIFNTVHPRPGHAVNLITLITKQNIYKSRCLSTPLLIENVIEDIEQVYNIEMQLAIRKGKMRKHTEKWSSIKFIQENESSSDDYINQYISDM